MIKIILDTNFFLIPLRFNVDIFEELKRVIDGRFELCIIDRTVDELKGIISGDARGKDKDAARFGLLLIEKKKPNVLKSRPGQGVDNAIVEHAGSGNSMVATMDLELKRRLKVKGIPRIVMRQQSHLILLK